MMFDESQIAFSLLSIQKTKQPPFWREKYTPFGAYGTTFPPEGARSYGPIICI